MDANLKSNIKSRSTWMRLVYMILFGIIFNLAEVLVALIVAIQFLFKLFSGNPVPRLQTFGNSLGAYFHLIVAFLTFRTEELPFPFAPWPDVSDDDRSTPPAPSSDAAYEGGGNGCHGAAFPAPSWRQKGPGCHRRIRRQAPACRYE